MLKCEADCDGGAQWVAAVLDQIVAVPTGPVLVAAFWRPPYRLRPWLTWQWLTDRVTGRARQRDRITEWLSLPQRSASSRASPTLSVIFTPHLPWLSSRGRLAMVTRPWAIYIQSQFFQPDKPPSPAAVLVFAHELVHVQQGPLLAASILGELLAYNAQAQLRPYLAPNHPPTAGERDAVEAAAGLKLAHWRQLRGDDRQLLRDRLRWWRERHPAYRWAPLLPLF